MEKQGKITVKVLILETLMEVLKKSVGTKMFQTIWTGVNSQKKDITEQGELSCAFYVSSILSMFGLIDRAHATVTGTVEAMERAGWKKSKILKPGVIIVWDRPRDNSHNHTHIGFYIGNNKAISNSSNTKCPAIHHYTFGSENVKSFRNVISLYKHEKLR